MDIQALLALQEEDGHLRALQRELRTILPKRRAEAKARLLAAKAAVDAATRENLDAEKEAARYERDYRRSIDRLSRAEQAAFGVVGSRHLQNLAQEHDRAQADIEKAEAGKAKADRELTPTQRRLDAARQHEADEQLAVQAVLDDLDARKRRIEEEIAKVTARRDAARANVPQDLLRRYDRLSLTRWPCAVEFNRADNVCMGCNLVQPPSIAQQVQKASKSDSAALVVCPSCGRILF